MKVRVRVRIRVRIRIRVRVRVRVSPPFSKAATVMPSLSTFAGGCW